MGNSSGSVPKFELDFAKVLSSASILQQLKETPSDGVVSPPLQSPAPSDAVSSARSIQSSVSVSLSSHRSDPSTHRSGPASNPSTHRSADSGSARDTPNDDGGNLNKLTEMEEDDADDDDDADYGSDDGAALLRFGNKRSGSRGRKAAQRAAAAVSPAPVRASGRPQRLTGRALRSARRAAVLRDPAFHEEANKRSRKRATPEQVVRLQAAFDINPLPGADERAALARELDMNTRKVQIWFQNRRAKMRREAAERGETVDYARMAQQAQAQQHQQRSLAQAQAAGQLQLQRANMLTAPGTRLPSMTTLSQPLLGTVGNAAHEMGMLTLEEAPGTPRKAEGAATGAEPVAKRRAVSATRSSSLPRHIYSAPGTEPAFRLDERPATARAPSTADHAALASAFGLGAPVERPKSFKLPPIGQLEAVASQLVIGSAQTARPSLDAAVAAVCGEPKAELATPAEAPREEPNPMAVRPQTAR